MYNLKQTKSEKVFKVFNYLFLSLLTLLFVIPFWFVVSSSLLSEAERLSRGYFILFPNVLDFTAFRIMLQKGSQIYTGFGISIFRIVVGTLLNMVFTAMLAYGLSKKTLPFRNFITFAIFFTTLFSGGLVPLFVLIKGIGLYNNLWALILPSLVVVWWMLLLRNFFMQIPESLEEAAIIDGASPFRILIKIMLPLSMPAIATISMFYAIWHWNAWFDAFIFMSDPKKLPVQNVLRQIIQAADIEKNVELNSAVRPPLEGIKSATIVIVTLPIICVYPFVQKYFVKGIMVGGVKG